MTGGTDRAVSTTLGFALGLMITTLLISGLLFASSDYVQNQRQEVIRSELQVIGDQVAANIEAIDRLASTQGTSQATVTRQLPDQVVGNHYTITVTNVGTDPYLELKTNNPDMTVTVDLVLTTSIEATSVDGGTITIVYTAGTGTLEVQNG